MKKKNKLNKGTKGTLPPKRQFSNSKIAFVILIFIFALLFLKKFLTPETVIYNKGLQFLIYLAIIALFGYLGWLSFSDKWNKKRVLMISIVGLVLLIGIYALAFDPYLDQGGDSSFYTIGAESFASLKGFRELNEVGAPKNTWGPPMLPFLMAPIAYFLKPIDNFTGYKIFALKMLPFFLTLFFVILCYYFLKNYLSQPIAVIITLLIATNVSIVHFSNLILTEIPFLFFSMLSLFLLTKFEKKNTFINIYLILAGFFLVATYWTRNIGLGFLVTSVLYFMIEKDFKRAIALAIVMLIFFIPWQIRSMGGPSQFSLIMEVRGSLLKVMTTSFFGGLKDAINVIPNNLFNYKIYSGGLYNNNLWIFLVIIMIAIGFIRNIIRYRSQMDLYFIAVQIPILVTSRGLPIELSRYYVVLTPLLIYYFYIGLSWTLEKLKFFAIGKEFVRVLILSVMSIMLFINLLGASDRIQSAHRSEAYPPEFSRYLETAFWAKDHTPPEALFGVRKSTMFYLFSRRHAIGYGGKKVPIVPLGSPWSIDAEKKVLDYYKAENIDYIVLDCFSASAFQLISPIIKNNLDKFTLVYTTQKPETYVFKLNKWW